MEIYVGSIANSLRREKKQEKNSFASRSKIERRRAKRDRRQSVRDGIFVTLSIKDDRRSGRDRRRGNL